MASIQRRFVYGKPYYYLVESRRVHGRPRPVIAKYLGKADDLLKRLKATEPQGPTSAFIREFGASTALWKLAQELDLIRLIDRHAPKRHQGPSVGQYMVLAAVNRCVHPTSKSDFQDWYVSTVLPDLTRISPKALTAQRFCDHMDYLDEERIRAIERDLSRRIVEKHQIDLRCLTFDCTNFDTFIDSRNPCELARRGHAKSKRKDLRVVGLALLVSTDFHVPLFSQVYAGNQPDSKTFASVTEELAARYRVLAREVEHITLVFDKGNNSKENLAWVAQGPFHVIGSLVPTQHCDLLSTPLSRFESLRDARLKGVCAWRTRARLHGQDWTLVVTRSKELLEGQLRGIHQHLAKKLGALAELQHKVRRNGKATAHPYTVQSVRKQVDQIVQGQYIREILKVEVESQGEGVRLTYRTDSRALDRLERIELGKRILFTDNHDWTTEEIVLGYRSQHHVEAAFRQMKDPHFVSWSPMFHWTDERIRVHAFHCVLALTLASLLQRRVAHAGVTLIADDLLDQLAGVQKIYNLYPPAGGNRGRPRVKVVHTRLTRLQDRLLRILDLYPLDPT